MASLHAGTHPAPAMFRFLTALAACLLLAGFAFRPALPDALAAQLVAPGGTSPLLPAGPIEAALARLPDRSGHVTTGTGVDVFWRAIDPGDYRLRMRWPDGGVAGTFPELDFTVPAPRAGEPRGTVVLLHGWMMHGDSMLPWALRLGEAGYRAIAIDLRNHGRSGEAPSGYGTREAHDVVDVVAALRARGEVVEPVHLLGVSYGAATALFAGADPRFLREFGAEHDGARTIRLVRNYRSTPNIVNRASKHIQFNGDRLDKKPYALADDPGKDPVFHALKDGREMAKQLTDRIIHQYAYEKRRFSEIAIIRSWKSTFTPLNR